MAELQKAPWSEWETVRLIGRGSFGTVYEIQRKLVDEDTESAALKVITIPQNPGDVEEMYSEGYDDESITATFNSHLKSIVAEYSLMRKMDGSANIVNCKDIRYIQHDDGIGWDIYIRMELLTPLMKALPVDADEAAVIKIGKDICNALVLCKKHEIVHRDIKPQNIFVSPNGDYKLGDFGIAKTVEKTMGGTKIGTYKYMAPEVYNNLPYGSAADIYSLGLVLYWLLNERRMPFMPLPPAKPKAGQDEESRHRRLSGENLPKPAHGSDELKQIVLKACAYDPKDRYASAAAMLDDLNKLTGGAEIIPPVVIPDEKLEEKQEDDKTTGPVFNTVQKAKVDNVIADDSDATVGPTFVAKSSPVEEKEEKTSNTQETISNDGNQKKNIFKYVLIGLGVIVAIVLFLLLRSCGEENSDHKSSGTIDTQSTITTEDSCITLEQLEWSDWIDQLPEGVTADNYEIEEKTLYSSRTQETTSSTESSTMDGWELFETVEANGEFGPWSDWTTTEAVASEIREVETQIRYRYRDKETSTGYSSTKDGWTQYNTTYSWSNYGSWSSWSANAVSNNDSRQVETKTVYRYRDKETTTGSSENMEGWTLYDTTYSWGSYGPWSDWSTNAVANSESRNVETKTQYRYRDISYSTEYTDWSDWSSWSSAQQSTSDLKKEESRTVWAYAYFLCPYCGAHMHGWGRCWTWAGGCGRTTTDGNWREVWSTIPWDQAGLQDWYGTGKYYTYINGELVFKWPEGGSATEYRYATRSTQQVANYGNWSSWDDTAYSNSSTREVQTRTMYRCCERSQIPTYHFYRWGGWSDWSDNQIAATNDRQVETNVLYRYRDRSQAATYHFYRWGGWSDWSDSQIAATNDRQVENATYYRYRDQAKTTTYYFRRWTEWSAYSETAVTPTEYVEVQTQTQYRYKSKGN